MGYFFYIRFPSVFVFIIPIPQDLTIFVYQLRFDYYLRIYNSNAENTMIIFEYAIRKAQDNIFE